MSYESDMKSRRINMGFRFGIAGGLMMVFVHLILLLMFRGTNQGDLPAWFLAWFVYLMVGRMAAQEQYNYQCDDINPLRSAESAGLGAGLVTSLIIWGFVIVRGIFRDAVGMYIIVDPVGLFCVIMIDILIAMGLGRLGGNMIVNKYRVHSQW